MNLPADLVFRPPDAVHGEDHEDYVNRLQGAIRVSHEDAGDSTFNQNLRQLTVFLFIAII